MRGEHGAYITGVAFTDGSMRNAGIRHAERAGWAVVQLDTASALRQLQQPQQQGAAGERTGSGSGSRQAQSVRLLGRGGRCSQAPGSAGAKASEDKATRSANRLLDVLDGASTTDRTFGSAR